MDFEEEMGSLWKVEVCLGDDSQIMASQAFSWFETSSEM